jgi:hypothetical protein
MNGPGMQSGSYGGISWRSTAQLIMAVTLAVLGFLSAWMFTAVESNGGLLINHEDRIRNQEKTMDAHLEDHWRWEGKMDSTLKNINDKLDALREKLK